MKIKCFVVYILASCIQMLTAIEDSQHWHKLANKELEESLSYRWNMKKAKNVILFVGDGMSPDTITASRIYHGGETSRLAWEHFPHIGILKTYSTNKQVPDSASTATALFGGVKTNYEVVGADANVQLDDCEASLNKRYHVDSFLTWAQAAGKATGFVTNTRVTHATPAPLYAHCADRRWECESKMPKSAAACKDIARQLVEDEPGRNIRVIMGGGRQVMKSNVSAGKFDPIDMWACYRRDGRDLIHEWTKDKFRRNLTHSVIQNNEELWRVDTNRVDYLLGIFANGHLAMDFERERGPKGQPSLEEMTVTALQILQRSTQGYFLMVEGGMIDYAHHRGHAAQALLETVRFSDAINATLRMVNTSDTLVIVTSDHTHSMTINGYSARGSSILGIAQNSKHEGTPYTTLSYSTGGSNNIAYTVNAQGKAVRYDPSKSDTSDFKYSQQATIISNEAHHGGGDVAVYAVGPQAHLFHSVHEQNYVAHVIAYAANVGDYSSAPSSGISYHILNTIILCGSLISLTLIAYK